MNSHFLPFIRVAALAAAATLAACGRPDDRTAGQQLDATVAEAKSAATQARNDAAAAVGEVKSVAKQAATAVADVASDAALTARVTAEIAKDSQLSAFVIDVDSRNGTVVLTGAAPTLAARERATSLVAALAGVKSVDNRLDVKADS